MPSGLHRWTSGEVQEAAAIHGWPVDVIYEREVGGGSPGHERYDPYQVGGMGELGPAQLKPNGGLLVDFERWSDGGDPNDPYLVAEYVSYRATLVGGLCPAWRYLCP